MFLDILTGKKERLLKIFGDWCDNVVDLLNATDEEAILRRDIYDKVPILNWGRGRVTLLGDSVHAMQPNMGQGGCMAIEVCRRGCSSAFYCYIKYFKKKTRKKKKKRKKKN